MALHFYMVLRTYLDIWLNQQPQCPGPDHKNPYVPGVLYNLKFSLNDSLHPLPEYQSDKTSLFPCCL